MMKKVLLLVTFLSFLLPGVFAQAEVYRRSVSFDWDAIPDATAYDVELNLKNADNSEGKKFNFKTKEAMWSGKLTPGKYLMRLRARDYRGVPGEWSPLSDFNVGLDSVALKYPSAKMQVPSKEDKTVSIPFAWQPVEGAVNYHFELISEDESFKSSEDTKETQLKVSVPVAKKYTWKVFAVNKDQIQSEATTLGEFTILGTALDKPQIEKPETAYVREIKWAKVDNAESYDVYLLKLNLKERKWEKFQTYENYKENSLPFDAAWSGGKYQVVIHAKGNLRGPSANGKSTFDVVNGDRSPSSEYTALVRSSIDRVTGWYGIASYLMTQIQYSGKSPENNSTVGYNALGGTGRIGAGWFSPVTPWGFLAIVDMSGFTFSGKTRTYASTELNAVYRMDVGMRGELRLQGGAFYKELPETIGDPFTGLATDSQVSAVGPHFGAEYWYSLTPKAGIQANIHLYEGIMKISTPNGQAMNPSLSTQMGFLGSYRFTPTFTGLMGYARREDKLSYKAKASSFTTGGESNTADITGNYVNFFAEWSF